MTIVKLPGARGWACIAGIVAATPLLAAASNATLTGRVLDERGRAVVKARVRLENRVTGYRQSAVTDAEGRYTLFNIPYNEYHLEVEAPGMEGFHRNLELRFSLPVDLQVNLKSAGAVVEVVDETRLVEDHPSVHLDIDQSTIDKIPATVQSRAMESILLATPGFVGDENGRFHFRGSHGQMTYVVDGIPVSDQMHATFSNSLDPAQVDSLEVITGGISAEYGGKPVVVVNITSKSGLGSPGGFEGEASFGGARFGTFETGFNARGGTDTFGYFVTGAASRSDRFLDPVNFENLHNAGSTGRLFTRFDWILGDHDTLRLSGSGGRTDREVANLASQQARGQDQRGSTTDANLSLAWTHLFSPYQSLDAAVFLRTSGAQLKPTTDLAEGFSAVGQRDFPVWASQDRTLGNRGVQVAYTQRWGKENTLKAGLQRVDFPIHETFRFAVTDPAFITDPLDPLHPYTPGGGGHIFRFEDRITPSLTSAYVQDDLHLGGWFLAWGLRHDRYRVRDIDESGLQPRLGISYSIPATGTVLRVSYDRLFILREHENLALSLSQQAWDLGPRAGTPRAPLKPELQDSWSYGAEQQFGKWGRATLEYWEKSSTNSGDNEQFLNTGVLFPVAAAKGIFRGMNFRFDFVPMNGISGYLSLGRTRAIFQAPLVGGLQLETPERQPGERFLIDHDQKLSAQLGLRWEREASYVQALGRHDSGLVGTDPSGVAGNPDFEFGIPFTRLDSEGTWRVKPRTTWNFSAGHRFNLGGTRALQVSADLLNAFDEQGLFNFLSVFGGTHVIPPRTLALRVKYKF
jgi:hypothetical protein